ncbi:DUF998 domain-containing protein [Streptomyces sp. NPDC057002]|uniref:DUF998 domain-containing protein n=1 Tax=Streptomyces sp. NPDC057002 TaxID=3345992 RepID=UPI003641C09D
MHAFLLPPPATTDHPALRQLTTAAQTTLSGAVALGALLHLGWAEQVDPVRQTLSDYALDETTARLFSACVGAAAAGSAALLAGLLHSRPPLGTAAPTALGVGCAGLLISAVFSTDPRDGASSPAGLVHRYAAGSSLVAIPAAGWLVARHLCRHPQLRERAQRIRRLSCASSVAVLLFFGTHVSATRPVTPARARAAGLLGLTERAALGLDMALLLAVANALRV